MRLLSVIAALLLASLGTSAVFAAGPSPGLPAFRDNSDWLAYRATAEKEIAQVRASIEAALHDAEPGERVRRDCGGLGSDHVVSKGHPLPITGTGSCTIHMKAGERKVEIPETLWGVNDFHIGVLPGAVEDAQMFPQRYVHGQGIDTGGVFKQVGDLFVFLRRGRLFSIRATDAELRLVSSVDAHGPAQSEGDWYEEMLVDGRTIVVLGYDSERGATRIELFDLAEDGQIAFRDSYSRAVDVRAFDYSGNYASRLDGHILEFYAPVWLDFSIPKDSQLPDLRRWDGRQYVHFEPLASQHVYRSGLGENAAIQELYLMSRCDLRASPLRCETTGVLATHNSWAFAARDAVYIWAGIPGGIEADRAVLRLPFDGSAPSSLRVQGTPGRRDRILEKDGNLYALVDAGGDDLRLWQPKTNYGAALLRVPLSEFGDSKASSGPQHYVPLDVSESGLEASLFTGEWLLYASDPASINALRIDRDEPVARLPLAEVGQMEPVGAGAITLGYLKHEANLGRIELGEEARLASQSTSAKAGTPDSRTDGSSYRQDGPDRGLFALPLVGSLEEGGSIEFFVDQHSRLRHAGTLASKQVREDGCEVSCQYYNWLRDARAIFIGERIYAMIGYELIEARLVDGQIREQRRIDFAPKFEPPACYRGEDYKDKTVPGERVVIEGRFNGIRRETTADSNGTYLFTGLPTGEYDIRTGPELETSGGVVLTYSGCKQERSR